METQSSPEGQHGHGILFHESGIARQACMSPRPARVPARGQTPNPDAWRFLHHALGTPTTRPDCYPARGRWRPGRLPTSTRAAFTTTATRGPSRSVVVTVTAWELA